VWDPTTQSWDLKPTITSTTGKVHDDKTPLAMVAPKGNYGSQEFDEFIQSVFNPLLCSGEGSKKASKASGAPKKAGYDSEIEAIKKKKVKDGEVHYLVKWKGWNNRYNQWKTEDELECTELMKQFEEAQITSDASACMLQTEEEATKQAAIMFGPDDEYAKTAVKRLIAKQKLTGTVEEFLPGYKKEILNIMQRRMSLKDAIEHKKIKSLHQVGRLRMILELKRDGRKKGRLILQGFREPAEWDDGSKVSPVAYIMSIYSHSCNTLLRIIHITLKPNVYPASWRHVSVLPKAKDDQAS
jgi:hypothetical protein